MAKEFRPLLGAGMTLCRAIPTERDTGPRFFGVSPEGPLHLVVLYDKQGNLTLIPTGKKGKRGKRGKEKEGKEGKRERRE